MRIIRVELLELSLPLVEPFVISGGTMHERHSLVVVLHDESGHRGYGESPPFELPFYSDETLAGARHLLQHVLIPRVVGLEFESPEAIDAALRPGVRGNNFARAAIETAAWDLEAHRRNTGLAALLAERLGVEPAESVPCGVALGIPVDRSADTLKRWIANAVAAGYRRVKIKVAPGWDEVPVRAAREVLAGTRLPLTVDANGGYEWPEHERELRALDEAELLYIEQPLHPDELVGHARLAERLRTQVCVDETLRDVFMLHEFDEMNLTDIAALLRIPRGTVASRLRRARAEFRKHVAAIELAWDLGARGAARDDKPAPPRREEISTLGRALLRTGSSVITPMVTHARTLAALGLPGR